MLKFLSLALALTVAYFVITVVPPAFDEAANSLREMGHAQEG